MIKKIEGLDKLVNLHTLNLQDNFIQTIENLGECKKLDTLYIKNNRIGLGGISDLEGLLECPLLTCVDVQNCKIDDQNVLDNIFCKMPNLKVLYCQNNAISKGPNCIKGYRKTIVAKIPQLRYLDDRPVFADDRRHAEAWFRGGIEEERKERELIRQEEREAHHEYHRKFKEMMRKAREEKRLADEQKAKAEAEAKGETWEAPIPTDTTTANQILEEKEEPQVYEIVEDESKANEEPPALEQVDIEKERELRAQEAANAERKQEFEQRIKRQQEERQQQEKEPEVKPEEIEVEVEQPSLLKDEEIVPTEDVTNFEELD
jgi:dynein assembly factor 1